MEAKASVRKRYRDEKEIYMHVQNKNTKMHHAPSSSHRPSPRPLPPSPFPLPPSAF